MLTEARIQTLCSLLEGSAATPWVYLNANFPNSSFQSKVLSQAYQPVAKALVSAIKKAEKTLPPSTEINLFTETRKGQGVIEAVVTYEIKVDATASTWGARKAVSNRVLEFLKTVFAKYQNQLYANAQVGMQTTGLSGEFVVSRFKVEEE